jgi:predicted dehydrogenase
MKPYRVAIIGTGGIATYHIRALRQMKERVEVVAAVDVVRERVEAYSKEHAIAHFYTDTAEMLEEEHPDLVHIATPPGTHYDLIIRSLESGATVLCEKPLCLSLSELDHILAVEKRTGKYCCSVFQWRSGTGGLQLKQLMQIEAFGRPLVGICQTTWFRDQAYYQVPWRGKWATEGGGPTMGHGIHAMDLFLWLLGDWEEVSAMTGCLDRQLEVEDVSLAMVRFKNHALGSIVNSVLSPREETYLRFDLQKATIELTALYGYSKENWRFTQPQSIPDAAALTHWQTWQTMPDQPASHATQIALMLDSLDRAERPLCSAADVRPTLELITGIYKSAATGCTVQQGSIREGDRFYAHVAGQRLGEQHLR